MDKKMNSKYQQNGDNSDEFIVAAEAGATAGATATTTTTMVAAATTTTKPAAAGYFQPFDWPPVIQRPSDNMFEDYNIDGAYGGDWNNVMPNVDVSIETASRSISFPRPPLSLSPLRRYADHRQYSPIGTYQTASYRNRVCFDYLYAECTYDQCRFPHISYKDMVFCIQYQNGWCNRSRCRLLHYSCKEMDAIRRSCNFLSAQRRLSNTEFENDAPQYSASFGAMRRRNSLSLLPPSQQQPPSTQHQQQQQQAPRRQPMVPLSQQQASSLLQPSFPYQMDKLGPQYSYNNTSTLKSSNNNLRDRLQNAEQNIIDVNCDVEFLATELRETKKQLQQQIEQLQLQQCSRPPMQQQPVMSAVSIAPVQVQTAPPSQIIRNPSIALAQTTQTQQLTLASQPNISSITLATAPSMGLTINTSQTLDITNATQPIISYPVMTHSILPH